MLRKARLSSVCAVSVLVACSLTPYSRLTDGSLRYRLEGDGTVRDGATNLVWLRDANVGGFDDPWDGFTWDEANRFVAEMNSGERPNWGFRDWRLPTAPEAQAFLCGGLQKPFQNLSLTAYWSATVGRRVPIPNEGGVEDGPLDYAWAVSSSCEPFPQDKTAKKRLWPVRGPVAPRP